MDTAAPKGSALADAMAAPLIAEYEVVRMKRDVTVEGRRIPRHTRGAVVAVYDHGAAYAVEIVDVPGGPEVVTLRASQIERMP